MSNVAVNAKIKALTQAARFCRNGKVPDSQFAGELVALANSAGAFRGKEFFRSGGAIATLAASGGVTRNRWRFAFHTGPFCKQVSSRVLMASMSGGKTGQDGNGLLTLTDVSGTVLTSGAVHYAPVGLADVPDNFHVGEVSMGVSPDTDYYGIFTDENAARALAVVVYEQTLAPDTNHGYIGGNIAVTGPILDTDRQSVSQLARSMWTRGAAQSINWCTELDTDVRTAVAVAADKNLVDNTSTTVTAATPGFTIDFTGKTSLAKSAATNCVNCQIAVFASRTGAAGNQGVKVKDASGTTMKDLNGGWSGTAGWFTGTLKLPATKAKYDLQYYSLLGNFSVYAVSIYEIDT